MKLLIRTKNKITKDKTEEKILHLEIFEVALVHCNIINNDYQHDSKYCIHLSQINYLVNY